MEVGGLALVGLQGAFERRGGGDAPVPRAGGAQRDARALQGYCTGIADECRDTEGLTGDRGGKGVLRVDGKARASAIWRGRSDYGSERDPERLV